VELPPDSSGKRRQQTRGGFASAKDAAAARAEVLRKSRLGELPLDGSLTVETWLRQWIAIKTDAVATDDPLRPSTAVSCRMHIERYLIPYLGHRKLADLTPMDLAAMFAKIRKQREADRLQAIRMNDRYVQEAEQTNADRRARGLKRRVKPMRVPVPRPFGPSSATRVRATISSALADAVAQGEATRNVAAQTRQRRGRKNRRPRVRVWEPDQLGAWLDALEAQAERLYPLVYVATFAGLRRGELCGLKWSAVDLIRGRITVDWQRTAAGYQVVEWNDPKTDESESTIDIDATTVAVLQAWRKVQLAERLKWGPGYHQGGYVFAKGGRPALPPRLCNQADHSADAQAWHAPS
jgi:integrase